MKQKICVLGEGAWGTAIASVLADNGHSVTIWCHDAQVVTDINTHHKNERYMAGATLHSSIAATDNIAHAMQDSSFIFCSTPVVHLRTVLEQARAAYMPDQTWIMLNKGIEQKTHMYATQIIDDVFETTVQSVFLCGPSFARDVVHRKVTAVVLATSHEQLSTSVRAVLHNDYFKPYISQDIIGAQICAAFKNTIAIGVGILTGAGYGDNTKAFFLTQAVAEIEHMVVAMGGTRETVLGLAGVGDIVLTAYSSQGRNVEIGQCIGDGATLQSLTAHMVLLPEGINTLMSVPYFAQQYKGAMPLQQALYHVVVDGERVSKLVEVLMNI